MLPAPVIGRYNKRNARRILVARYREGVDGMQIFVEVYRAANPIAGVPMVGVTRDK
jgi:hypothetical protein